MKKYWKLSYSLLSAFKSCPMRCYYKYVLNITPVEDTDSQRMGTNWHRLLEIMGMKPGSVCPDCCNTQKNPECPLCGGTDCLPEDLMDAAVRHLNQAYSDVPLSKTADEWAVERDKLLYSLAGYNWYYADDDHEVVAQEIPFSIKLRNPITGRVLPNVEVVGKIDKIMRSPEGTLYVPDHKSTSKGIDPDSTYWNHLNLDTQTTLYPFAARQMQLAGELEYCGIKATDPLISGAWYDVWHKPTISPKKLTQADSKKFIETGEYMGEKFEAEIAPETQSGCIYVNGVVAEAFPGKKDGTFAIRETPEMYGARLLQDVSERPEFYFARRTIPRTDAELKRFEHQLYGIYKTLKFMERTNAWWANEHECERTFRCDYTPICYQGIRVNPENLPEGFYNRRKKDGN